MPAQQVVAEGVTGALIVGNGAGNQGISGCAGLFVARAQGVAVLPQAAAGAEDGEVVAVEEPQMLVIADRRTARQGVLQQQVAAKKGGFVADPEQAEQGGGKVDLAGQGIHFAGRDEARRINE